jgi:hypothetical protein
LSTVIANILAVIKGLESLTIHIRLGKKPRERRKKMVIPDNVADKLIEIDRRMEVLMRLRDENPGGFDMLIEKLEKKKAELLSTKVND